ncbi:MAG: hypothetical protein AUF79_07810 [Crenarchaeota archaeon 13_1_20CM_2_51_8]|nr:MAG: hypothetical protein AUF79_07810 [Crenarchaeota archaeon 13_1_20CM_2_51_8]
MRNKLAAFLILVVSFAAISSAATFFILSPRASQPFMAMGVYSRTGLLGYLEPATNSSITSGKPVNWTLSVTNNMGSAQFVTIIVRLANSTLSSSNSTTPSNFPEIVTHERFIRDGSTTSINFNWTIQSVTPQQGGKLLHLQVEGEPIVMAGDNFRWIFELWTYDLICRCFHYGYGPQSASTGVWLQVWFNPSG